MSNIITLKEEAKLEIYQYIDKHIRSLPKKQNGKFDEFSNGFLDNDVDALRHAYVSGVYTMVYNEETADKLGQLQELVMTKDEFLSQIKEGNYSGYSYKTVDGIEIPISKRDRYKFNNLG